MEGLPLQYDELPCGFDGNPDFYGLGVRVGFYLQMSATCLSMIFMPSKSGGAVAATLWLQFSFFFGLIYQVAHGNLHYAESSLILSLLSAPTILFCMHCFISFLLGPFFGPSRRPGGSFLALFSIVWILSTIAFDSWAKSNERRNMMTASLPGDGCSHQLGDTGAGRLQNLMESAVQASLVGSLGISLEHIRRDPGYNYSISILLYKLLDELLMGRQGKLCTKVRNWFRMLVIGSNVPNCIFAVLAAVICVVKINQTEAALGGTHITGISSLSSVGQIIPLTMGIGTLLQFVKNMYAPARLRWKKLGLGNIELTNGYGIPDSPIPGEGLGSGAPGLAVVIIERVPDSSIAGKDPERGVPGHKVSW